MGALGMSEVPSNHPLDHAFVILGDVKLHAFAFMPKRLYETGRNARHQGTEPMRHLLSSVALIASLAAFGSSTASAAQLTYGCDPGHSEVRFTWSHAGFSIQGARFGAPVCKLVLDQADAAKSSLEVTLKIAEVNTGVKALDEHFVKADFFDAAQFPEAKFVSTAVKVTGEKTAEVAGDLTIRGQTKPVTMMVSLVGIGAHPVGAFLDYYKGDWASFSASFTINPKDFGFTNPAVPAEVPVTVNTEMKAQ
jgi:polyisoprenoid-binding protein YceI